MLATVIGCSPPQSDVYKHYPQFCGETNQHKRLVHAPPASIFAILTDAQRFTALSPPYTHVAFETPPPYGEGTRLKIKIDHLLKFTWHTQVMAVIPNRMIRLAFLDGFFKGGVEIWELEPKGQGTLVIHTIIVAPRGWLRQFIWHSKARHRHNAMVENFLDDLKNLAESQKQLA